MKNLAHLVDLADLAVLLAQLDQKTQYHLAVQELHLIQAFLLVPSLQIDRQHQCLQLGLAAL